MKSLTDFFIDNAKFTFIVTVFLGVGGLLGLAKLNNESYPAVNFATAIIETRYEGATPQDIETKVTKPIEDEVRQVTGLKDVRSTSQPNVSKITVRVDMDNYDVAEVMSDLQRAVDRVSDLPSDLKDDPVFTELKSEEFPAIELAVVGDNTNRFRDEVADSLKTELEDNKKVLNVRLVGFQEREFRIFLIPEKLRGYHIGIDEVLRQLRSRNSNIPSGDLENINEKKLIRVEGKIKDAKELEEVFIRTNFSGQAVQLKDIARVEDASSKPRVHASHNGREATLLVVNKKAGADTIALVNEVDSIIKRFQERYRDQFELVIYNNEAEKVKNRTDILFSNAVTGLVLVIVFLLIFLPGRIGIMASLSLPLAILGTFGVMPFFGMNIDAITVLALVIALGMMVDNSVVISENFTRLRQEGLDPKEAAVQSIKELALPITCTALTTIAAFLPMLVTKGVMGEFIKYIPIVVTSALIFSLIESFFLLPVRLVYSNSKVPSQDNEKGGDWFVGFIRRFESFMDTLIRRRYLVALGFTATIVISYLFLAVFNKFELFPAEETEIYVARLEMPQGATLATTQASVVELSKKIKEAVPEKWLKHVVARSGLSQANPSDQKSQQGDYVGMAILYASEYAKFNVEHTVFLERLDEIKLPQAKDLTFEKQVNGPPVGYAINATFRSTDVAKIDAVIEELTDKLGKLKGVRDLQTNAVIGPKELHIKVDYEKSDRLGLSAADVGNAIRTAMQGNVVSDVTLSTGLTDLKEVDLRVEMDPNAVKNEADLSGLQIMDQRGNLVPVSTLATIEQREGTPHLKRYDFKRSKTLIGNVDESLITSDSANQKIKDAWKSLQKRYPEVSLVFGGQEENTKESMQSLGEALVLALIGIFGLLVFLFRSYLRPMIIMSTIPLGLVGFSVAFYFHGRPSSFLAMIGLIGLAGIIVNAGIVLISFIDQMRNEGKMSLHEILVKASGMRLRAVLVTSLTTISGLFPTAYGIGGSDAILVPMTLAMAWGLTSGTILTIIWVPCAYAILEDFLSFVSRVKERIAQRGNTGAESA